MARLSHLKLSHQALIRAYPFRRIDWRPGTILTKPWREARIALITTAGLHLPSQPPFHPGLKHDDCSYRELPGNVDVQSLLISHTSGAFDHTGIEADRNLAFPLDRLREIGGPPVPRHFSLMGSILAPARLIDETGPEIAAKLLADGVEGVALVPV